MSLLKMRSLVLFSLFALAYAKHEQYIGWKSYFVRPFTTEQIHGLHNLVAKYELDFLSQPTINNQGIVLVQPQYQSAFVEDAAVLGVGTVVHADDIKEKLDEDDKLIRTRKFENYEKNGREFPYDNYQELGAIYDYLDDIAARYSDRVTLVTPAHSFEGRPIKYVKISTSNFEDVSKPVIVIDGGIHAREWISPPTVVWAINKLTDDLDDNELIDNFDWILLPVVNPDGYAYTFSDSRFWRKTRSNNTNVLSAMCPGVDGNRNYDFFWNTIGTSATPCSDVYAGDRAFSEIETQVVRNILQEYLARIPLYITIHSYGSMILYPWGHDGTLSNNGLALHSVGINMADAIFDRTTSTFRRYTVGNAALVLGPASGASEDYAHSIGIPLSYTYELPGLSGGLQGFHLDPIHIRQVVYETWYGLAEGARRAAAFFKRSRGV